VWIVDADSEEPTPGQWLAARRGERRPAVVWLARATNAASKQLEERFGPEAVVIKPFRQATLLQAVARATGRRAGETIPAAASQRSPRAASLVGQVLVVEDNPVNAAVAEGMLATLGCRAHVVSGGQDAVARALAERFDLILMDLHMPDLDGMAATALIRRGERDRRTPIIALTADAAESNREACLAAGMDDFLGKPFSLEELRQRLRQWLPVAAAVQAALPARRATSTRLDASSIARIRALDQSSGPGLLQKVASLYAASSTEQVQQLRQAVANGQLEAARSVAHTLKSGSANVGATDIARLCQLLERACIEADLERARDLVEQLVEQHPGVLEALQTEALRDSA
jgi:CheY-like chemotaxis protein/HPt (histidine-containing phosphotransfer) domain-containing protein